MPDNHMNTCSGTCLAPEVATDFPDLEVAQDGVTMSKHGVTKVMKVPKDSKTLARAAVLLQTQLEAADRYVATLTSLDQSLGYQLLFRFHSQNIQNQRDMGVVSSAQETAGAGVSRSEGFPQRKQRRCSPTTCAKLSRNCNVSGDVWLGSGPESAAGLYGMELFRVA